MSREIEVERSATHGRLWRSYVLVLAILLLVVTLSYSFWGSIGHNLGAVYLSHAALAGERSEVHNLAVTALSILQTQQNFGAATKLETQRLQVRAMLLSGDESGALDKLQSLLPQMPDDLADQEIRYALMQLGQLRVGLAADALAREPGIAQLASHLKNKQEAVNHYLSQGRYALDNGSYYDAIYLLQLAQLLSSPHDSSLDFQTSLAAILADNRSPAVLIPKAVSVYEVGDGNQIEGEHLQWQHYDSNYNVKPGDRLGIFPSADSSIGTLWWEQPAGSVIKASEDSCYAVTIRARQVGAPAGFLQIEIDRKLQAALTLGTAWNTGAVQLCLTTGLHVLQVVADDSAGDAEIDWIRFERNVSN